MKITKDVFYTADNDPFRSLDIFLPEQNGFPVFVYFHGGGLVAGNRGGMDNTAKYLCERGVALVSAEYRLMPSADYPDFLDDAAAAVKWVADNIPSMGGNGKIFVGGSSAGGYISQMLCFDSRWLGKYGIDCAEITGYIHDAGQPTAHFNVLKSRGIDSRRVIIDETSPLYHVGILPKVSPMLVIWSDHDMENRPEQTALLLSTLKHFRYPQDNIESVMMHGKHCQYVYELDGEGESRFAKIVYPFIERFSM